MPFFLKFFLFFALTLSATSAVASPALVSVIDDEILMQVAQQKQWQHLLHYRTHPFTLRFQSQNDSPKFFLSPEGKTSLQAELEPEKTRACGL